MATTGSSFGRYAPNPTTTVSFRGGPIVPTPNQSTAETARLNRYEHQANNVVSNPTPGEKIKLAFQSNLLDNYDAVTYHFKLFMVSTTDSGNDNLLNNASQVVIAESGVSDLTIDKIELDSVAVPSVQSGTGTMTNVKFEIVEPSGAGLLDNMYYQSIELGVGNWNVMPLYLQLEFRGRDPATSNSDADGSPSALGNMRWLWPMKITDIKANVTNVGTRYEFSGILYNELAQANSHFSIEHNISLANIDTFQSAINELSDKIAKDQILKLIDNYGKPDIYKFVIDPLIAGYHIKKEKWNADSARGNSFKEFDGKTANFLTGTGIDKIIDTLLAHTEEYQTKMLGATTPGAGGAPIAAEHSQMKQFWRIITETRPLEFDKRRNDNAVEHTIFVIAYDMGILDANVFQTTGVTPAITAARLKTYYDKGLLKKKYNYIFTGLNDQIVNLDLNFNQSFATALTRYGGVYLNSTMHDKGMVQNNNAEIERQTTEALRKVISLQIDDKATAKQRKVAYDEYTEFAKKAKLSKEQIEYNNNLLKQSKPENKMNLGIYYNTTNKSSQSTRYISKLAKPLGENIPAFVSDVNINDPKTLEVYKDYLKSMDGGQLRPVAYREGVQDKALGAGVEASSNSGITKLSSIFSTALHAGMDTNLLSVKMTIKGDPFWLFPHPLQPGESIFNALKSPTSAIAFLKNSQPGSLGTVNLFGGDNFILLRFRTPRIFNIEENTTAGDSYTQVDTFSGVYRVINVKSRFEMGKFVHDLDCQLDPVINLTDISALIEFDAANQDVPTTVTDFVPSNNFNASKGPVSMAGAGRGVTLDPRMEGYKDIQALKRQGYDSTSEALSARLKKARL